MFFKMSLLNLSRLLTCRQLLSSSSMVFRRQVEFSSFRRISCTNFVEIRILPNLNRTLSTSPSSTAETEKNSQEENATENAKKAKRIYLGAGFLCFGVFTWGVAIFYLFGPARKDAQGHEIVDEFTGLPWYKQYFKRSMNECKLFVRSIQEPSRDTLLPDPIKPPYYQPRYTVVLEINGVLVHPEWTFNTGWRFKKRQGVDYFLKTLGYPNTELVVYTSEVGMTAHPIVDSLDPEQNIMYRLYRDCTKYENGAHIKVLSKLNRDLSRVIFIDWDNEGFKFNPDNALRVKKWTGDDDDMSLIDLAHLIKTIIELDITDVRPVLQYYSSCDDPVKTFRENAKKLQEQEVQKIKSLEHQKESPVAKWSSNWLHRR